MEIIDKINAKTPNGAVYISERRRSIMLDPFAFSDCCEETRLVVIDECNSIFTIDELASTTSGIQVNIKGENPFIINPVIIVITDMKPNLSQMGASFTRRFKIVEFPRKSIERRWAK